MTRADHLSAALKATVLLLTNLCYSRTGLAHNHDGLGISMIQFEVGFEQFSGIVLDFNEDGDNRWVTRRDQLEPKGNSRFNLTHITMTTYPAAIQSVPRILTMLTVVLTTSES